MKWTDTPQTRGRSLTPAAPEPTGPVTPPAAGPVDLDEGVSVMRGILFSIAVAMMLTAFALAAFAPPREALAVVVAPMLAILGGALACLICDADHADQDRP